MNQEGFIRRGQERWSAFEELLKQLEQRKGRGARHFPRLYRAVCHDLALARQRQFDAHLVDRLNSLALRGHNHLYKTATSGFERVTDFFVRGFPQAVRRELSFVVVSALAFYGVGICLALLVLWQPELVYSVLDTEQVVMMETIYDPQSTHHLRPRGYDSDAAMFGFYVRNNMGVGFRTFASGIFFGLGSLFFLLYNGVMLGAVTGHMVHMGYGVTFSSFVIGHSAFELQAVVLAGAAGLRMGWSLIAPGPYKRSDALKMGARAAVLLVFGSTGLFLVAAVIEAFWSASVSIPAAVKYVAGGLLWLLVTLYFSLARRVHGS